MRRTVPLLLVSLIAIFVGFSAEAVYAQARPDSAIQFSAAEPPSGALDRSQLEDIAASIRKLERHPRADGADKARIALIHWFRDSPDVSVDLCSAIASPFAAGESPAFRRALQQHLLSTAAYMIEHPDSEDIVSAKISGLNGALRVLEATSRTSDRSGDDEDGGQISQLVQMREEGTLRSYVERGVEACRGS